MAKVKKGMYEANKAYLSELLVLRATEKTTVYDKQINELREEVNQFEFGSFNKTLTNKKSLTYKDLISLKKNKTL